MSPGGPPPLIKTALEALASGAATLAGYVFSALQSLAQRISFLSVRFPGLPSSELDNLLGNLQQSYEAGSTFEQTGQLPSPGSVPINPGIPTPNTNRIDVVISIPNPNDPDHPTTSQVHIDVPADIDPADIDNYVNSAAGSAAQTAITSYEVEDDNYATDELGDPIYDIYVLGITRS
jgi:hypothetical protein